MQVLVAQTPTVVAERTSVGQVLISSFASRAFPRVPQPRADARIARHWTKPLSSGAESTRAPSTPVRLRGRRSLRSQNASVEALPPAFEVAAPLAVAFLTPRSSAARSRDRPQSWSSGRTSSAAVPSTGSMPRGWPFPFFAISGAAACTTRAMACSLPAFNDGATPTPPASPEVWLDRLLQREWWWRRAGTGGDREEKRS